MIQENASQEIVRKLLRKFEHPKAGTWERVELDIKRNRMGWGTLFLNDHKGNPLKNREIRIRQKTHDFRFGCNAFKLKDFKEDEKNRAYEEFFQRVFNEAVVPLLWDSTEVEQGKLRFAADSPAMDRRPPADAVVDWCEANRIAPKGHWIFCRKIPAKSCFSSKNGFRNSLSAMEQESGSGMWSMNRSPFIRGKIRTSAMRPSRRTMCIRFSKWQKNISLP